MPPDLSGARVLLVGDWPPPLGGVAVHVRSLRDAARTAGAQTTVLDVGRGQHRALDVVPSGGMARFPLQIARLAATHGIVHLHTGGANPKSWALCAAVGLAARACGATALVTLHSGSLPRFLTTPSRAIAARLALQSYARVVCVSEEISRLLRRLGAAEDRHLVAPAFGREGMKPEPLPATVRSFRARRTPLLAAMMAPERHYGLPELLGAFSQIRARHEDAGLVLFGPMGDAPELPAGVLALGPVERGIALGVMQAADVFIRPTLLDGDAVSVREALLLGTRVVATAVGTRPPEVVTCAPGDADSLANAIEQALSAPPAIDVPPPVDGIEAVLRLYERLVAGSRPAPPLHAI